MLQRGLYQIYTGDAKGKTTAAVGLAVRARGAGLRVCFIQFIKGGSESSELALLRQLEITVVRPARESSGVMRGTPTAADRRAAMEGWEEARAAILSGDWDLVVLDEAHIAIKYGLLCPEALLEALAARPTHVEVVTTGRGAPDVLRAAADLITEMTLLKHPYDVGIPARRGIEF